MHSVNNNVTIINLNYNLFKIGKSTSFRFQLLSPSIRLISRHTTVYSNKMEKEAKAATKQDFLNNPTWVKRAEEFFYVTDVNKNGVIELDDFRMFAENLKKFTNNKRPEHLKKALEADMKLAAAVGIKEGDQFSKEQWIDGLAKVAAEFNAKLRRGERPPTEELIRALFSAVDINEDGVVTLDEYTLIFKAYNMDETAAAEGFATLDKDKNGKLDVNEIPSRHSKFWWLIDDEDAKGLFGERFEVQ